MHLSLPNIILQALLTAASMSAVMQVASYSYRGYEPEDGTGTKLIALMARSSAIKTHSYYWHSR